METDPEIALPRGDAARLWARTLSRTAAVALVFCGVVLALLLFDATLIKSSNPYNHLGLATMVDQLQAADEAHQTAEVSRLVKNIRDLDVSARSQFFKAHAAARRGWVLLFIGATVFLFSTKAASVLQRQAPLPAVSPEPAASAVNIPIRNAVIAVMAMTALVLLIATYAMPERQAGPIPVTQLNR